MEPVRRTRLQATGLLAITFVVGGLVGMASQRVVSAGEPGQPERVAGTPDERRDNDRGRRGRPSILLDTLVLDQLATTPAQRTKIQAILAQRDSQSRKLLESIEPSMHQMMEQTRLELRSQLTPEQNTKLDQIIKERIARRREQREGDAAKDKSDTTKKKTENQP
jgi:Spy/CpxP family protein refolding chaperone